MADEITVGVNNEETNNEPASGYEAYLEYQRKLNDPETALSKQGDTDLDDSVDGTILANVQQTSYSNKEENETESEIKDDNIPKDGEETSDAESKNEEPAGEEEQAQPEDSTQSEGDNEQISGTGVASGSDKQPLSEYAKRYQKSNDRIRNAINSAKFLEQEAEKRIREKAGSFLTTENVIEHIKKTKEAPQLLEEFTMDDLTGILNPTSMLIEGGRINEETGDRFTEEEAKYFLAKRNEINKGRNEEFKKILDQEATFTLAQTEAEIKAIARKTVEDTQKLYTVLDTYPELDLENENLPEPFKVLANKFWEEVSTKYSDKILDEELLKDDFDVIKAAQDFLGANKDYIKTIEAPYEPEPVKAPEPEPDKGAIAPSGSSSAPNDLEPKDKEEMELDALISKHRDIYKNTLGKDIHGRKR
jgi:hypothetical protein